MKLVPLTQKDLCEGFASGELRRFLPALLAMEGR